MSAILGFIIGVIVGLFLKHSERIAEALIDKLEQKDVK